MSSKEQGVTFWDVSYAAGFVGKVHGGRIRITLDLPMRDNTGKAFDVRVALWRVSKDGNWFDSRGVSEAWPNANSRTFSGLLLRLVNQLDHELDITEQDAMRVQQMSFADK